MQTIKHVETRQYGLLWAYILFWFLGGVTQLLLAISGAISYSTVIDATKASALWLIPLLWWPQQTRAITAVTGIIIWLFALPIIGYFLIYHQELTKSLMMIVFESNMDESTEYLENYFSFKVVLGFVAFTMLPLWLWTNVRPVPVSRKKALIWTLLIMLLLCFSPVKKWIVTQSGHEAYKNLNRHFGAVAPWQLGFGYINYKTELAEIQRQLLAFDRILPLKKLTEASKPSPSTIVLVIGESTNRYHMSLYGYGRKTNPKLESIKSELKVFDAVYSPRPNTIESLEQVLTFADQLHPDAYKSTPSVIAMMKQAGYKTIWITNQQTLTERNTMLTTFAKQADEQVFLNTARRQNSYSFDEKVLQPFKEKLKDKAEKKFVIVHLLGTHMKYDYRYPEAFNVFSGRHGLATELPDSTLEKVNTYDNAVLYNDYILYSLISELKTYQHSMLMYFSDHGEDVYDSGAHDFLGRNEGRPSNPMYAVPFVIWQSKDWFNRGLLEDEAILHRQYDNSDFIYTLADLVGLSFDEFKPDESLVNPAFELDQILVGNPYQGHLSPLAGTLTTSVVVSSH